MDPDDQLVVAELEDDYEIPTFPDANFIPIHFDKGNGPVVIVSSVYNATT